MSKTIKDLLPDKGPISNDTLSMILNRLNDLRKLVATILLQDQLEDVTKIVHDIKKEPGSNRLFTEQECRENAPEMPLSEALDNLETMSTVKKDDDGKRLFLLHRPTEDYEYEKYIAESAYEPSEDTEWVPEYETSEEKRSAENPVVACWVPESSIKEIPHPHANTGTWGELGKNPHANRYTVIVKPGKYDLYQELKS
jgi:hypothetical protein